MSATEFVLKERAEAMQPSKDMSVTPWMVPVPFSPAMPTAFGASRLVDSTAEQSPASEPCKFCTGYHVGRCPDVAELEYHPDGTLKKVVFISAIQKPSVSQVQIIQHMPESSQAQAPGAFVGGRNHRTYHRPTCNHYVPYIRGPMWFANEDAAKADNRKPCRECIGRPVGS